MGKLADNVCNAIHDHFAQHNAMPARIELHPHFRLQLLDERGSLGRYEMSLQAGDERFMGIPVSVTNEIETFRLVKN